MTKKELALIDSIIDTLTFVEESLNTGNMAAKMAVVRDRRNQMPSYPDEKAKK